MVRAIRRSPTNLSLKSSSAEHPVAGLSDRELQVLSQLALGHSTREVAVLLNLSVSTIETYRGRILEKLNLRNNSDITRFALRHRLIEDA